MAKYKIVMFYADGEMEEEDEVFDTKEAARDYALYLIGCCELGAEILEMSNPGDYPFEDYIEPEFKIIKVKG